MKVLFPLLLACAFSVNAQTYPAKPVKLAVPFPAGSATDQIARVMGQQLQEALGQPFVVENKPGAQGSIAATEVARGGSAGSQVPQAMLRSMGRIDFLDVPYK